MQKQASATTSGRRALYALALGGFGIGLTEFVIMGLLPEVAAEFSVTEAVAGYLISGYALAVAVGALLITSLVGGANRKLVLSSLMLLFIAGNLLSAIAPTYEVMLLGRIVAAMTHGAYFGIGAVTAASLVPESKKAGAVAIMFTGLTLANVLGVPFGTLLGQHLGWRSTFWAITVIGILAFAGVRSFVPSAEPADAGEAANAGTGASGRRARLRAEYAVFARPQVIISILLTVFGFGGVFAGFTYIAYTLTEVSGFASGAVPLLLVVFGAGLFVGNLVGGKAADRHVGLTLLVSLAGLALAMAAFAALAASTVATVALLFLMGLFGFATVPPLQMRVMQYASGAPTLASAANIGAFNLGNALGAWLGGLALTAGLGFAAPLGVGSLVTVVALALLGIGALPALRAFSDAPVARASAADPASAAVERPALV
ncbi:MFS transporter [Micrococcales bacterium 31B]|nr:MFS transporter [Micrococcales bacterium 31B]